MAHIIYCGREGKSSQASRRHDFITWSSAFVCGVKVKADEDDDDGHHFQANCGTKGSLYVFIQHITVLPFAKPD